MRTPTIRIVDFSGGTDFHHSLEATRNLILSTAALWEESEDGIYAPAEPLAHVEKVSSADTAVLTAALHAEALVLHLASHMNGRGSDAPSLVGRDSDVEVSTVAGWLETQGRGIYAACLYVDGCNGGTQKFTMRDCLEAPVTYIGARRMVTEPECTLFAANFYGGLLQRKGKGLDPLERTRAAAENARDAYAEIAGKECPFRVETVEPSRRAARAFAS
ncbi:hypothetical protein [Serinicoccus marinus]|uniref:hypothetical protein n=1 Tax=Serinicoccus marinus TaxID=247333 RepID=UPI0003B3F799|nr:hypothetical protein [Serinicoccus marinus]